MDPAPAWYTFRINGHLGATMLSAFPALARNHRNQVTIAGRDGRTRSEADQMAFSASALVTARPRAPYSCRSPNISMRMDWSRPPTRTGS
jgi:hypothetical protein